jgi:hypothetical protein
VVLTQDDCLCRRRCLLRHLFACDATPVQRESSANHLETVYCAAEWLGYRLGYACLCREPGYCVGGSLGRVQKKVSASPGRQVHVCFTLASHHFLG